MSYELRSERTPGVIERAKILVLPALLLIGMMSVGTPASGQTPAEPPAPESGESAEPQEPVPVPLADLPREGESDSQLVDVLAGQLADSTQVDAWTAAVTDLEQRVGRLVNSAETQALGNMSLDAVRALRSRWQALGSLLDNVETRIAKRASDVAKNLSALERLDKRWSLTVEALKGTTGSEAVGDRVKRLRERISQAADAYRERLDALLVLQGRVEAQSELLDGQLKRIDEQALELRGNLLAKDQPALWALFGRAEEPAIYEPIAAQVDRQIESLEQIYDTESPRFIYLALIFVAIWLAMSWVARSSEPLPEDDPAFRAYQTVVKHPAAVAMVLTLISLPWVVPNAPLVLYRLSVLVMIPAVLFLIPRMGAQGKRMEMGALRAIIGLFVIHRTGQIFLPYGLSERMLLLMTAVAAAPLLLRLYRDVESTPSHHRFRLNWILKPYAVLCVASVVANILGHVTFARLLLDGVLSSIVLALVLNIGTLALSGMVGAALRTPTLRRLLIVRHHGDTLRHRFSSGLYVLSLLLWAYLSLSIFGIWGPLWSAVSGAVTYKFAIGSLSISLGGILLFLLIIWLGFKVAATTRFVLQEDVFPRVKMARGVPQAITKLTTYGLVALAIFAAITASGLDMSRLALLAGALSLGIGFGLQNIVNNFVSGLILIFERPIEAGDTVEVGTLIGQVTRIGIRSSTVRTYDGAEVIVPNADLISKEVVNWTLSDRYKRLIIPVGVAYGTDPRTVLNLLVDVAREDPDVLSFPEPYTLFRQFGDSSLNFELRCWCAFDVALGTNSRLNVGINDALAAAGIEIPFPQRDLHLRSVDSAITATFPGAKGKIPEAKPEADSEAPAAGPPADLPAVPNEGDVT
jgi:small-conductance mechanosensitive channel